MKNVYFFSPVKIALLLGLGLVVIALVSNFASKPPTGKTGAPGEGTCMDCHTVASSTIDGSMELSGLTSPIVGGMTYDLVLTMKKTAGSPVRAG